MVQRWSLYVLALAFLCGCGQSGPQIVPVKGVITYGGGGWPTAGGILLAPFEAAGGQPLIPTIVTMAQDGSFTAESTVGAGLIPGKYRVAVECWELPPDDSRTQNPLGRSYVPARYQSPATSGLAFDVPQGSGPIEVKLDVPRP